MSRTKEQQEAVWLAALERNRKVERGKVLTLVRVVKQAIEDVERFSTDPGLSAKTAASLLKAAIEGGMFAVEEVKA
jgi:hypothetical protein